MKRRNRHLRRLALAAVLPLAALALALAGCTSPQQVRSQCAEEAEKEVKYDVQTVGDVMSTFDIEPVQVGGVGLVSGLEGTGGDSGASAYRSMLERELQMRNVRNVRDVLSSPDNALVVVSAVIPPGAHKNDPIDVEVALPPGSRATSLRGGVLQECRLYNFEYARNLDPAKYGQSEKALQGFALAQASGPLLVGIGDGDAAARLRQGILWGGGRCRSDMPCCLRLDEKHQYASVAAAVAQRVNERFGGSFRGPGGGEVAVAKTKSVVLLGVPLDYRHNIPRYLRLVRLLPLREAAGSTGPRGASGGLAAYRNRLEEDLLNPSRTLSAALRLEALGKTSMPALKAGLSGKHPLVRFASAEALAYLDCPTAGEELARAVEEHPVLRAFSLAALASMDQAVSHLKLRELLASPNAEARYGAFQALRALDERDPAVQGELLNNSFWLHRVAPNSPALVHMSTSRRAEVVLFGEDAVLAAPFEFLVGDAVKFTITAGRDDEHCTLSRFSLGRSGGPRRETRQCSLKLEDALRTLADLGGTYPEAIDLLRQIHDCRCLSCAVEADQLPQAVSVEELAHAGKSDADLLRAEADILDTRPDFGATPTLYEPNARPRNERRAAVGGDGTIE
jgi:hypothetical protein